MNNQNKKTAMNSSAAEPGAHPKKRSVIRILALLAVLAIVLTGAGFGLKLFGSVDMSSSEVSGKVASDASTPSETAGASTSTTVSAATASKTTSTASIGKGGHYIQPAGAVWNLKLANPWNPVSSSYSEPLTTYAGDNQYDTRAIDALRSLVKAGSAYNIRVCSTYRSIELQTKLFNNQVKSIKAQGHSEAEAENIAAQTVARPGTSEHNLGLAVDFLFENRTSLTEDYKNTDAYKWMMAHCADYGFILRYPENKSDITGYSYEPWHYRYVGVDAAKEIMSRGLTLEEYLQEKGK